MQVYGSVSKTRINSLQYPSVVYDMLIYILFYFFFSCFLSFFVFFIFCSVYFNTRITRIMCIVLLTILYEYVR